MKMSQRLKQGDVDELKRVLSNVKLFFVVLTQALLLLMGGVVVILLASSASFWLYAPWFWTTVEFLAVTGTVVYSLRRPPVLTVNGSAVPQGKVIALRCVLNAVGVALLWHIVIKLNQYSQNLPFWLLIEMFLVPSLFIGWGVEPGSVEAAILTPLTRQTLKRLVQEMFRGMIIPVVSAFYWATAGLALLAVGLALSPLRWMPGWGVWVIAWLVGGIFGWVMADALVRLPRIKPLFEAAEVNGATGMRISNADVFIPYTIVVFLGVWSVPIFATTRRHNHLPPLVLPHFLVYIPLLLALLMAALHLWAWSKRDPADAERERQAFEEEYQAALAANELMRERLIAYTEAIVAAWDDRRGGDQPNSWLTGPLLEQFEKSVSGQEYYGYGVTSGETLRRAVVFLSSFRNAVREGSPNLSEEQGWFGRRRAVVLSWEEAVGLVQDVGTCLREGRDINNPRLLLFLGERT